MRRCCFFFIGSAPPLPEFINRHFSVRLWEPELNHESDSGDETRQDLKIPTCFRWVAPSCALLFLPSVYRCHSAVMAAFVSFHA